MSSVLSRLLTCEGAEVPVTAQGRRRLQHDPASPARALAHLVAGRYAWIAVDDPKLLDFPHAEVLLIGERGDIGGEQSLAPA
jgi:hypothetical protein